jgi:biotin carboxyl carrier protein
MTPSSGPTVDALQHIFGLDRATIDSLFSVVERDDVDELEIVYGGSRIVVRRESSPSASALTSAHTAAGPDPEHHPPATHTVTSPTVGRFRSKVHLNEQVSTGQALGTLDILGVAHPVTAPSGGVVSEVLVEETHVVEFGQPLLIIRSNSGDH